VFREGRPQTGFLHGVACHLAYGGRLRVGVGDGSASPNHIRQRTQIPRIVSADRQHSGLARHGDPLPDKSFVPRQIQIGIIRRQEEIPLLADFQPGQQRA
jgi:hypothetical protein